MTPVDRLRDLASRSGVAVRSCFEHNRDDLHARGECFCRVACRLRASPIAGDDAGPVVVRFPYVDVDGLTLRIEPDGRISECGHSILSHPEATVQMECTAGGRSSLPR